MSDLTLLLVLATAGALAVAVRLHFFRHNAVNTAQSVVGGLLLLTVLSLLLPAFQDGPAQKAKKMEAACRTALEHNLADDLVAFCAPLLAKIDNERAGTLAQYEAEALAAKARQRADAGHGAVQYIRNNMPR